MDIIILACISSVFVQRALGSYQLAHFLRGQGYTVQVVDHTDNFTTEELVRAVKGFITADTLVVGISSTFYNATENNNKFISNGRNKFDNIELPDNVKAVMQMVKATNEQIKIVVGGAKSTAGAGIEGVDAVIHGYAEDKFLSYLNTLPNNGKRLISKIPPLMLDSRNGSDQVVIEHDRGHTLFNIENLDHRFLDQDLIFPGETIPIEVSRGCIFQCSFCAFPLNGKTKMDYLRDPIRIRDEMLYNHEKFGITNYFISDDTFNDSTQKIEGLHRVITDLPFKINFTTYLRLDLLHAHREQIQLLKEMGLASPFFGVESFNHKSAASIGKGMNSDKAKAFLQELDKELWPDIPITCSFIIGLPHDTKETVQASFDWVKNESNVNSVWFPLSLLTKTFYKSKFNTEYAKYGYHLNLETGYWSNEHFTYDEANDMAEDFNNQLMRKADTPSSWFLMTLLNHGYTLEEAKTTSVQNLSWHRILRNKSRMISSYKQNLFNLSETINSHDQNHLHAHQ